jgi:hypothetical protein
MNLNQTIKSSIGKKTLVLTATAFITICSAATVSAQKANFSGDWKLNEGKSELGQFGGRMAAKKIKLDGQTESLAVQRFSVGQDGAEITTSEKLTFDGKATESTVFGGSKKSAVAKWSDDGKALNVNSTINFERDGQAIEIKITEKWTLSEDGKSLTIESTSNSSFGTNTMKLVYDKAS